jgi:hypothetical protein
MQARLADYGIEQINFFPLIFEHSGDGGYRDFAFLTNRHNNPKIINGGGRKFYLNPIN